MQPKIYSTEKHKINPAFVDQDAIYVIKKLRDAGFLAYLVGGGVRDLLVGRTPKDFDISTSARPEQIKRVFQRRCILIGRRFRLAHLRFGHKVIEVSTFRSGENDSDLIVQDNEWGSPEEDVLRRDFTINGLFYDPEENNVIDYVGGWEDLQAKLLRTIGDPLIRFKQDPVRMIRLLKFHARFGFVMEEATLEALNCCRLEITKSSPARLLEEVLRMLESGAAAPFFKLLAETSILQLLFPGLKGFIQKNKENDCYPFLTAIDAFHAISAHPMDRSILLSALLYPILNEEIHKQFTKEQTPHITEITLLACSVVKEFTLSSFAQPPRRLTTLAISILATQYRLTPLFGRKHHRPKFMRSKEFDLAMQFFLLRTHLYPALESDYQSWLAAQKQIEKSDYRHSHPHPRMQGHEPSYRNKRKKQEMRHAPPTH